MNKKLSRIALGVVFAFSFTAEAQQPKIPRIGYLTGAGSAPSQAFLQGLRDLGYVEGQNITIEYRSADGKRDVECQVDRDREKDMKKKITVLTLCVLLFAPCWFAAVQQTGKIFRIGYLDNSTASGSAVSLEAFRQEMSKLGWIEGKNITIEYRFSEQKFERLPELAADLVRLKVDLIVVASTVSALAAKSATTTIPIVMTNAGDPVAAGLVASLARPGGNVTGSQV